MVKRPVNIYLDVELIQEIEKVSNNKSAFLNDAGWAQIKQTEASTKRPADLSQIVDEADAAGMVEARKTAWLRLPFEVKVRVTKRAGELLIDGWRSQANPNDSVYSPLKQAAIDLYLKQGSLTEDDINKIKPETLSGVMREVI